MTGSDELGDDELAALGSSSPRYDDDTGSDLEALGLYTPTDPGNGGGNDPAEDLVFTAANPPGTVAVTALLGGECKRIDLAPAVAALTETELAAEIVAVAKVAAQKAGAGAYELVSELFRRQGQDPASIHDLLQHQLHLPTPEQAVSSAAELAARYW